MKQRRPPVRNAQARSRLGTPEFVLGEIAIYYEEALAAGTDHALTVADVSL